MKDFLHKTDLVQHHQAWNSVKLLKDGKNKIHCLTPEADSREIQCAPVVAKVKLVVLWLLEVGKLGDQFGFETETSKKKPKQPTAKISVVHSCCSLMGTWCSSSCSAYCSLCHVSLLVTKLNYD